ncbi:MAG: hypothetical protein ABI903_16730 [Actinomycetota bacterium]
MTTYDAVDPALQRLVQAAIDDLALRLDVPAATIAVAFARPVLWPDRSLGCPQPGMAYPQVSVDGAKIELSTGGAVYSYHSGGSRLPFLCGGPRPSGQEGGDV